MFWFRVILYLISRRADEDTSWADVTTSRSTVRSDPAPVTQNTALPQEEQAEILAEGLSDGKVTREEIQKLFGSALRVR